MAWGLAWWGKKDVDDGSEADPGWLFQRLKKTPPPFSFQKNRVRIRPAAHPPDSNTPAMSWTVASSHTAPLPVVSLASPPAGSQSRIE